MGRIRITGACLALVFAVSAVAATSASAEVPELGRCLKVEPVVEGKKTVYSGLYGGPTCLKLKPSKKGKYEWYPGPGVNNKYYGVANEPEPVLETTGGLKIVCADMTVKGEYTGPKTQKVTPIFGGCETGFHRPCQTIPAEEGTIEGVSPLAGELGTISKTGKKRTVGWDIKGEGVTFTFSCGKLPEVLNLETIEGSVIGTVYGGGFSNLNRMNIESLIRYKQVAGKQVPESFEGGPKETLLLKSITEKTEEQMGLATVEEAVSGLGEPVENPANQEPLEIKAK